MLALEVLPEKECDETLMQKHKNHPTGKLYRRKAFVEREIAAAKPFQTQQNFFSSTNTNHVRIRLNFVYK